MSLPDKCDEFDGLFMCVFWIIHVHQLSYWWYLIHPEEINELAEQSVQVSSDNVTRNTDAPANSEPVNNSSDQVTTAPLTKPTFRYESS